MILSGVVIGFLLVPVVAFMWYDITYYEPHKTAIAELIQKATDDERNTPLDLRWLLDKSLTNRLAQQDVRILIWELNVQSISREGANKTITTLLWIGLVNLHLNKDEQIAIYCSRSYMGNSRYGFSVEAMARFGKPLSALNREELATLVALTHAPSLYEKYPDKLSERRDWLLSRKN